MLLVDRMGGTGWSQDQPVPIVVTDLGADPTGAKISTQALHPPPEPKP